jgi:hypothetical protein
VVNRPDAFRNMRFSFRETAILTIAISWSSTPSSRRAAAASASSTAWTTWTGAGAGHASSLAAADRPHIGGIA